MSLSKISPGYIDPKDGIMLVRKEALLQALKMLKLNSEGINTNYWKVIGHIYDLIPRENNFIEVKFSALKFERYAVFSYQWKTPWDRLTCYINGQNNPMLCDWLWVDIICLDQNDTDKMQTIANSDLIYKNAKEYHIMEVSSLKRGWIVYEISSVQRTKVINSFNSYDLIWYYFRHVFL
jgi:hypothetical protein